MKITKEMLQQAPIEYRESILQKHVDNICEMVLKTAKRGETSFLFHITDESVETQREWAPFDYAPSIDDLINGLAKRFEGVFIRRITLGILIDWA